jgi:multidrug efflux system membrane fusion protein
MPNGIAADIHFGSRARHQKQRIVKTKSVSTQMTPESSTLTPTPRNPPPPHVKKPKRWPIWIGAILILAAGGGYLLSQRPANSTAAQGGANGSKKGAKGGAGGAIPVAVETVKKGNMGEYIEALGTVTPVYTDTITSRVAGQLMEVDYKEGQIVHKGDLLAVIDPRPYAAAVTQAQGQLDRDTAALEEARIDSKRYQTALDQHAIPEQQFATQQATVHQDEGTVMVDQGNLDAAKVNVAYTKIISPIDGRVGLRQVDPGNIVQANGTQALAIIAQLQPITVIFTMAEDYITDVATQLRAGHKLKVDAMDRSDTTILAQGTVLTVDNQIDTTTGTVKVRATFPNSDYRLFPNEFVNAKLLVKTLMGVNIVPNAAIQRNNDISFVYVVDEQNKVHSQNVQVATTNGLSSAVSGVKPGDRVVIDGFDKLQDNAQVRIRPASSTNQKKAANPGDAAAQAAEPNSGPSTTGSDSTAPGQTTGMHKKRQKDTQ